MLPDLKEHQSRAHARTLEYLRTDPTCPVLVVGPCGSGKSRLMFEMAEEYLRRNKRVGILTHRQMLTDQLAGDFEAAGSPYTIFAAGYKYDAAQPIQIMSAPTVFARVFRKGTELLPDVDLLLVDEAHQQTGAAAQAVLFGASKDGIVSDGYTFLGKSVVGYTATPLMRSGLYGSIVEAGTYSEMRRCGMHQIVKVFSPDEIDVKALKPGDSGDYSEKALEKRVKNNTAIYSSVFREYERLNPQQLPMILFAPSIETSRWFAQCFCSDGVPVAHLDGELIGMPDMSKPQGSRLVWRASDREGRQLLMQMHKSGEIKGICNRFVLREAVNMPWCYHAILATVAGGLSTYLQIVGRLQRFWPSYDHKLLQCHGGCLDDQTEVLTDRGWQSRTTIRDSDLVAGFDVATSKISWQPILHRHDRPLEVGEQMYGIKNDRMDIRVTGNHRLVYKRRTCDARSKQVWPNEYKLDRFDVAKDYGRMHIPVSGNCEFKGVDLLDHELTFLGWWLTDGCRSRGKREEVSISQKETYYGHIESIRGCLKACGLDWTETLSQPVSNLKGESYRMIKFLIPKGTCKSRPRNGWWKYRDYLIKELSPLLMEMTDRQFEIFVYACHLGDGSKDRVPGSYRMLVANTTCADRLQAMAVMRGWKCGYSFNEVGHRMLSFQKTQAVSINVGGANQVRIEPVQSMVGERVWCVANPLETLVIRRNGKVAIVGNSYWRHGSPNEDRKWNLGDTNKVLGRVRMEDILAGKKPEGIRCPKCNGWRMSGPICPHCGHAHEQSVRAIRMLSGRLKQQVGRVYVATPNKDRVQSLWNQTLFSASAHERPVCAAVAIFNRKAEEAGLKVDWNELRNLPPLPTSLEWHYSVNDYYPWLKRYQKKKGASK